MAKTYIFVSAFSQQTKIKILVDFHKTPNMSRFKCVLNMGKISTVYLLQIRRYKFFKEEAQGSKISAAKNKKKRKKAKHHRHCRKTTVRQRTYFAEAEVELSKKNNRYSSKQMDTIRKTIKCK